MSASGTLPEDAMVQGSGTSANTGAAVREAPLGKLTTGLLKTYRAINEKYYYAKKERQKNEKKDADYQVCNGDMLGTKYRVLSSMGKGSFGQVVSAEDVATGQKVAVKVIKNREAFRRQARTEIKLLELLNARDPNDSWCIVRFLESFEHNGHVCLVFEHLAFNLYELLRRTHFRGVAIGLIRKFARQILTCLAYLALPEIDVIHCDLKPENILFRVPNRSALKVIDFGSSCQREKQQYKYIQSRFYRSPEVILELPYNQAIDMWSLGCILVELHTGMPLFSGKDEGDQIRRFVALKGTLPRHMLAASRKTDKYFDVTYPPGVVPISPAPGDASERGTAVADDGMGSPLASNAGAGGAPLGTSEESGAGAVALPVDVDGLGVGSGSQRPHPSGTNTVEGDGEDEWYDSSDYEDEAGVSTGEDGVWAADGAEDEHGDERMGMLPSEGDAIVMEGEEEEGGGTGKGRRRRKGSRGAAEDSKGSRGSVVGADSGSQAGGGHSIRRVRRKDSEASTASGTVTGSGRGRSSGAVGGSGSRGRLRPAHMRNSRERLPVQVPRAGPIYKLKAAVAAPPPRESEASAGEEGVSTKPAKQEPPVYTDLRDVLGVYTGGPGGRRKSEKGHTSAAYLQFVDLIERMLDYDPRTRIKPMEAMNHPFLRVDIEEAAREKEKADAAAGVGTGAGQGAGARGQAMGVPSGTSSVPGTGTASMHGFVSGVGGVGVGVPSMLSVGSGGGGSGRGSQRGSFQGIAPGPGPASSTHALGTPLASPGGTAPHSAATSVHSSPRHGAHAPTHSLLSGAGSGQGSGPGSVA